jgi:hypothetical protein
VAKNRVAVIDQDLLKSKAWLSLGGIAPQVYMLFMCRRRIEKLKVDKRKKPICTNCTELVFPYREAERKFSITQPRFRRAIDTLIEYGFIDISTPGSGTARMASEYALSERWRDYGKPNFKQEKRSQVKVGFCRTRGTHEE